MRSLMTEKKTLVRISHIGLTTPNIQFNMWRIVIQNKITIKKQLKIHRRVVFNDP